MASVLDQALATNAAIDKVADKNPDVAETRMAADAVRSADATARAAVEKVQPRYEAMEKSLDLPPVPLPDLKTPGGPPKSADYIKDPTRVFGQFMPMLVAFGSLATRRGGINAIRAAAKAMDAAKANDREALEFAHQEWVDQTKATLDANDIQVKRFNAILDNRNMTLAEKSRQLEVLAAELHIPELSASLAKGDLDAVKSVIDSRSKASEPIRQIVEQAQRHQEAQAQLGLETQRLAEERRYHEDDLAFRRENIPVDRQAYDAYLKQHPGDIEGAAKAAGKVYGMEHANRAASMEAQLRKEAQNSPAGKAYASVQQFMPGVEEAEQALQTTGRLNAPQSLALADSLQRILTNQAIRQFSMKAINDHLGIEQQVYSWTSKLHKDGGFLSPDAARAFIDVAKKVGAATSERMDATVQDAMRRAGAYDLSEDGAMPLGYRGPAAGGGASGAAQPMPKAKADLKADGTIYQTGRGPATWDGTHFTPVTPDGR